MKVLNRPNSGKPWTAELDQSLINMFREHVPFPKICEWHGRTGNSIVSRLVHLNVATQIGHSYFPVADTPFVTVKELRIMEAYEE